MIQTILNTPTDWTNEAVELASQLQTMKQSYASMAAAFSQAIYIYQDALGLEGEEVIKIQTNLAQMRQTINDCASQIMELVIVNQPSSYGDLPKEDVETVG
jgi:uncharacterized phage infection (PIP) family protein YhgE